MSISALVVPTQLVTEFRCLLCGEKRGVEFTDPAAYNEADPLPNKNQWVRDQAIIAANARLDQRAQAALRLVVCPQCKRRDGKAVRTALLKSALPLVGVWPGLFMLGVIATALLFPALAHEKVIVPVLVGSFIVVAATPVIAWRRRQKLLDESDRAVRFLPLGKGRD